MDHVRLTELHARCAQAKNSTAALLARARAARERSRRTVEFSQDLMGGKGP